MWSGAFFALLVQAVVPCLAFVATPSRSRGGIHLPVDAFAASAAVAPGPFKQLEPEQETPFFSRTSTALLVGACVAAICSFRRSTFFRAGPTTRYVWTQHAAPVEMNEEGEGPLGGPAYRMSIGLNRQAKNAMGRKMRYLGQQKKLKESGIWWSTYGAWTKWDKNRDLFNMYEGPESHPDNPWFPAASGGYRAMRGWVPAQLGSSAKTSGTSGAFVGGSAPRICSAKRTVESSRAGCSALVMHAHKKAASSTKNHGGGPQDPKFRGVSKSGGLQGSAVKNGQLLVKQTGMNWYAGANVTKCSDGALRSVKEGIVQWRGHYKHKEIYVVPWEYVNENCVWKNNNTLAPKVYEPWMGDKFDYGKRHFIMGMYPEWKQSEAGQEYLAKKQEKKDLQKVIMKKIRAHKKEKRREGIIQTREPREPREKVSESDSEKEA
ncbi:unnamed protein product [Polarella glacialis]|uniref:50S ribosomal protein L27, chloroplastic n=1 Tax=Polarella glacialis TaxID=89957 RepID=A0A813LT05_POLGL|nr:unnamed protein product [Polarella glacialis]